MDSGRDHSLYLSSDREVYSWGKNENGQLGVDTLTMYSNIPVIIPTLDNITFIACGGYHSHAISSDGKLYSWGANQYGQLGTNSQLDNYLPTCVDTLENVVFVSCGGYHSLALLDDGRLFAWGRNQFGRLGIGHSIDVSLPNEVEGIIGDIVMVSCGWQHSVALTEQGLVYTWGRNDEGQLGLGHREHEYSPQLVKGLRSCIFISGGGYHSLAITDDGSVWAWGKNEDGQLGIWNVEGIDAPMQVKGLEDVEIICSSAYHAYAMTKHHETYTWGYNGHGRLGIGNKINQPTPVKLSSLENIIYIACGGDHSVCYTDSGQVFAWGHNDNGQLGIGNCIDENYPVEVTFFRTNPILLTSLIPNMFKNKTLNRNLKKRFVQKLYATINDRLFLIPTKDKPLYVHEIILLARCPKLVENPDFFLNIQSGLVTVIRDYLYFDQVNEIEADIRECYILIDMASELDLFYFQNFIIPRIEFLEGERYEVEERRSTFNEDINQIFLFRYCDMKVHVTDCYQQTEIFLAHTSILSIQSDYFDMIIRRQYSPDHSTISHTTNFSLETFKKLFNYFYLGPPDYSIKDVLDLLKFGDMYLLTDKDFFGSLIRRVGTWKQDEVLTAKELLIETSEFEIRQLLKIEGFKDTQIGILLEEKFNRMLEVKVLLSNTEMKIIDHVLALSEKITQLDHRFAQQFHLLNERLDKLESKIEQ